MLCCRRTVTAVGCHHYCCCRHIVWLHCVVTASRQALDLHIYLQRTIAKEPIAAAEAIARAMRAVAGGHPRLSAQVARVEALLASSAATTDGQYARHLTEQLALMITGTALARLADRASSASVDITNACDIQHVVDKWAAAYVAPAGKAHQSLLFGAVAAGPLA